jgi:ABC-2 type transport system permease protein
VNRRIVGALVAKDFKLFFRNRFFALITVLALVSYVAIYFFMPKSVDETLEVAVYAPEVPPILTQVEGQGLQLDLLDSEADLRAAIVDGDYAAGVVVPTGLAETLASGREGQLDLYFRADTPEEVRDSITVLLPGGAGA